MSSDDPLERLAAEEDWRRRAKGVEDEVARARRKQQRGNFFKARIPSRGGTQRISWLFLVIVALMIVSGVLLWTESILPQAGVFIFILSGWLVTLCFHEFAHALAAHRGGDDTVVGKGYLTLDPRKYGHPLLTFILPLLILIIGGMPLPGGAVMIETHRLRNRFRDSLVSASGPAVNLVFAIVLLFVVSVFGPAWVFPGLPHYAFWAALTFLAYLQVVVTILNLLPVPGLDGYGIIEPYLPGNIRHPLSKIKPFGIILIFLLLYLPPVRAGFNALADIFMVGAPVNGEAYGYILFQFWR